MAQQTKENLRKDVATGLPIKASKIIDIIDSLALQADLDQFTQQGGIKGDPGDPGVQGIPGDDGDPGRGIQSAVYDANTGVVTFTYTDGTTFATGDLRGEDAAQGAAPNPSVAVLAGSGITVTVLWFGETAPSISGGQGAAVLTVPSGTSWQSLLVEAANANGATQNNDFSFTISNANPRQDYAITEFTETGDGEVISPGPASGLTLTSAGPSPSQVVKTWAGAGSFDGFRILFINR